LASQGVLRSECKRDMGHDCQSERLPNK
jgi:hypothetical protein